MTLVQGTTLDKADEGKAFESEACNEAGRPEPTVTATRADVGAQ